MLQSEFLRSLPINALAFALIVLGPIGSYYEGCFFRGNPDTKRKVNYFRSVIVMQWVLAATAIWIVGLKALFKLHSQDMPWLSGIHFARNAIAALLVIYFMIGLIPLLQSIRGEKFRQAYARAYQRAFNKMPGMLPSTAQERLWFAILSVTAGICEETLCRGFLFHYLRNIRTPVTLLLVLLISAVVFGMNHLYQGYAGILATTIAGLAFGSLFLLTGNLLLPILLHAVVDLQVVLVLRPRTAVLDEPCQSIQ